MTPQELRKSILLLAFKGKLINQNKEESSSVLLSNILKHGFGNKKFISFEEDLAPYDIPENWSWCMFHNIVSLENGKKEKGPKLPYLEAKYLRGNTEAKYLESGEVVNPEIKVILVDGENSGEVFFVKEKGYMGSTFKVLNIFNSLNEEYVLLFMKLHQDDYRNNKKGAAIPHLNKNVFFEMPFPIAPLEEQERIVAKINELMPLVNRYEEAWNKLGEFNEDFPDKMKNSLLEYSIKGKLVSQEANDGTAIELFNKLVKHNPTKQCKSELNLSSMDFDIPTSWCWIELNQLFDFVDYRGKTPHKTDSGIFLITASNIREGFMDYTRKEYISEAEYKDRQSRGITKYGDLLFTTEAPMGNAAICDLQVCSCGQRIITFKEYFPNTVVSKLFMYFILSPSFQKQLLDNCTGTTAKGIKAEKLKHLLIPLPPYKEQERIVAKLEELLPLCRKLIK